MKKHYGSTEDIERARQLRLNSTEVEKRLWFRLRDRQLDGFKFRRQHRVGNAVLDFACEEVKLAVELDGGQHNEPVRQAYDAARTDYWNSRVGTCCGFGIMM